MKRPSSPVSLAIQTGEKTFWSNQQLYILQQCYMELFKVDTFLSQQKDLLPTEVEEDQAIKEGKQIVLC